MKTLAAFLAAGGMMIATQAAFAQRDAASKMDGEAYEIDLNANDNRQETFEDQDALAAPAQTVKTGDVRNDEANDRQENRQNDQDDNSAEPQN